MTGGHKYKKCNFLPLVSPGIVATAIYVFINAWNEYLYAMILMSSSDKTTISVAVKTLEGADILNWGSMMAACAIVVIPSILFFCFIQNKMAGGPSEGAVNASIVLFIISLW